MIKSLSTQTGDFSYSLNLNFTGYGAFHFGFSGDADVFGFSGQSGKIYDQDSNFFYSYEKNETVNISGNKIGGYNNYFINNILFNSQVSQGTGYVEKFYSNGPVSPSISFFGETPSYSLSGVLVNGRQTGNFTVENNSDSPISFKIYSGNFVGPSGDIFYFSYPFDSGSISSFKNFTLNSTISFGQSGTNPVQANLFTNFGNFSKNVNIYSIFELESFFSLSGPTTTNKTGFYDYTFNYDLVYGTKKLTDPYQIDISFNSVSGEGDVLNYIIFSGYSPSGSTNVIISGNLLGSGNLTGRFLSDASGYNTGLQYDTSGISTGTLITGNYWATGDFNYPVSIPATGQATGNLTGRFDITGVYNFETTGTTLFTGQTSGSFDFTTGIEFSGLWDDYDNRLVFYTSTQTLTPSGIAPPIAGPATTVDYYFSYPVTGKISGSFKDTITVYRNDVQQQLVSFGFTGNVYSENPIFTGLGVFTGITGYVFGINSEKIHAYGGTYTGIASGTSGVTLSVTTQENVLSNYTGNSTGIANFNFTAQTNLLTGTKDGTFYITNNGRYEYTGENLDLTGSFYTKIQSTTTGYDIYELTFQDTKQTTGFAYFTGDYTFSGTGFYVGDCTGVGFTGVGVVGFTGFENVTILPENTGYFYAPQITGNFNSCLPLSGSRWFDNPLEISGNSGIAVIYPKSDRAAPVLDFSANDSARSSYTGNPFVLTYKWMEGSTVFSNDVKFSFSPYYYASGTGVYVDTNSVSAAITFYSGNFPSLDYKEIEFFAFDDYNGWNNSVDNFETPSVFNTNTGDWKVLITTQNSEVVKPSGFFFLIWSDVSESTQNNSPKVFNSYLGGDSYGDSFVPTQNFTGFVPSVESGRPTGEMSLITVLNYENNFIERSGLQNLQLLTTGTGFTSSIDVSGRNIYELTGSYVGTSRSGFYFGDITGYQNAYVDTGILNGTAFYYNYATGFKLGQSQTSLTAKNMFTGKVGANYSVEQFSGDLESKVTGFGFELFLDGSILNISGSPATSTIFGLSLAPTTISASYNNFQNDFNTLSQIEVSSTGISYKELEFPTAIAGTDFSGTLSGNSFSFSVTSDFTGFMTGTGLNTGIGNSEIPEGYNQTGVSGFYDDLYYGDPSNLLAPSRNVFETLYSSYPLTGENWSGNYNQTVYNTGEVNATGLFTGIITSGNVNVPFTGQITGITTITGLPFRIEDGSGTFIFNDSITGHYSSLAGFNFGFSDKISNGVFIEQPSGFFSGTKTGLAYYQYDVVYSLDSIDLEYYAPSYIKTFTGEYDFYTGASTGSLVQIPYDMSITGYTSGITITGENSIIFRVHKKKHFDEYPDKTQIFYTGQNGVTGGLNIT